MILLFGEKEKTIFVAQEEMKKKAEEKGAATKVLLKNPTVDTFNETESEILAR